MCIRALLLQEFIFFSWKIGDVYYPMDYDFLKISGPHLKEKKIILSEIM